MADLKNPADIEQQLKLSRESLEFALQSGKMGMWDVDLETNRISCSQEMLDLWGISHHEFDHERSTLQKKVHPDDLHRMNSLIDYAIDKDSIYEFEYRITPTPGTLRWVLSRGRLTYDETKKPIRFSGIVYDITDRKKKEEALALAVSARDEFFMVASHELRTPLTCLKLQLQVLECDLKSDFPEAFASERIHSGLLKQREQILRITQIIDNILDFSKMTEKIPKLQLEQFDLCEMVKEVLERLKLTTQSSGVEVRFTPEEEVVGTWDRFRLEQVLINLLINAIRYGERRPIHVYVSREGQLASLSVVDQGKGIKAEDQLRIFERFERAAEDSESGMGLGLYISKNIIRAHGGEILLESEYGMGSKFSVVIPVLQNSHQ
jgi:PAS domain S-box-containing protein